MNVYTHTHTGDLVEALATLATEPDAAATTVAPTGADGANGIGPYVAPTGVVSGHSAASDDSDSRGRSESRDERNTLEIVPA